jgi:2-oxoglutarate ferredoxin oxidoreductase subunit alpha
VSASLPTSPPAAPARSFSLALAGSGGAGVMTAGTLLLDAAARAGLYGLFVRTSGPQIRGGEAAALLRLSTQPLATLDDGFHLLLAIDWLNLHRFADEIPLGPGSLLIGDADEGEAPAALLAGGARAVAQPLKKMAKASGGWVNMVALGCAGALAGLPEAALAEAVRHGWKRGDDALARNLAALQAGFAAAGALEGPRPPPLTMPAASTPGRWLLSGNEAAGAAPCAAACASSPPTRSRRPPNAGVDGARAGPRGRHAAAGRGRTGLGEHDHRRRTVACRR